MRDSKGASLVRAHVYGAMCQGRRRKGALGLMDFLCRDQGSQLQYLMFRKFRTTVQAPLVVDAYDG
jgi:hypothetical protein